MKNTNIFCLSSSFILFSFISSIILSHAAVFSAASSPTPLLGYFPAQNVLVCICYIEFQTIISHTSITVTKIIFLQGFIMVKNKTEYCGRLYYKDSNTVILKTILMFLTCLIFSFASHSPWYGFGWP